MLVDGAGLTVEQIVSVGAGRHCRGKKRKDEWTKHSTNEFGADECLFEVRLLDRDLQRLPLACERVLGPTP